MDNNIIVADHLKNFPQFITHHNKVPVDEKGNKINHLDSSQWMSYDQANIIAKSQGYGLSFVLDGGQSGLWCIDGDNCRNPDTGKFFGAFKSIIDLMPGVYVEISRSGTGGHLWGVGKPSDEYMNKNTTEGLEFYYKDRHICLGHYSQGDICDWSDYVQKIQLFFWPKREKTKPQEWTTEPQEGWSGPTSTEALIECIRKSSRLVDKFLPEDHRKASVIDLLDGNNEALARTYPNTQGNGVYDASSADAALAMHLAFWTGGNCEQIEKIMRMSALKRKKWDKHKTYLRKFTISSAVAKNGNNFYNDGKKVQEKSVKENDWPEPVDFFQEFPTPSYPTGLFPKVIDDFALSESELMGTSAEAIAMSTLTVCAALIPDNVKLIVKQYDPSWKESTRMWTALVGPPSSKKSPIISLATRALKELDSKYAKDYKIALSFYNKDEDNPAPIRKRIYANDTTVEAFQQIAKENEEGILVLRDELSAWIGSMEKYNAGKGGSADRGFWLEAYNGGPYNVDRVGRGSIHIKNLSVSLIGGIQPDVIAREVKNMAHDGLLQRFYPIILPPANVSTDKPVDDKFRKSFNSLVFQLPKMVNQSDGCVSFQSDGHEVRERFAEYAFSLSMLDDLGKGFTGWAGKLEGMFARTCLLFTCVEAASKGKNHPTQITFEIAHRVERLFKSFLVPHALIFYGDILCGGDALPEVKNIAGLILSKGEKRITKTFCKQNSSVSKKMEDRELENVITHLVNFGWLKPEGNEYKPKAWIVNPLVHSHFTERASSERKTRKEKRQLLLEKLNIKK